MNSNSSKNILGNRVNKLFPNMNKGAKPINIKKIVIIIIIIIIVAVLLYIIVKRTREYKMLNCQNKVNYFKYLFGLNKDICQTVEIININLGRSESIKQDNSTNTNSTNNSNNSNSTNSTNSTNNTNNNIINEIENDIEKVFQHDEVFHIDNQDYTYDQAKCKCKAYGARLAKKDEVVEAYNKGANWCNYGWTEGQSAFYPVQKCYWDKMMEENSRLEDKSKMRFCGLPGVNGGYFDNSYLKFGVNCYGKKPEGKVVEPKKPECPHVNKDLCTLSGNENSSHKLDTDNIAGFSDSKWYMND